MPLPAHLRHLEALRQGGLPQRVEHAENAVTFDTPANRFVRYALEHWQALAFDVQRSLTGKEQGPARRGRDECRWLIEQCAAHLGRPPLRDAGPLRLFPQGDPVLRRQAGYRDVLRTFALADASLALVAELPDDPFAATQRNVATLYEYWCFFQLAAAVSEAVDDAPAAPPFRLEAGMLSLTLKQGEASRQEWVAEVAGRRLGLSLWFNRDFRRHEAPDAEYATWALRMRPDASLRIRPLSARPGDAVDPALDVWLHFDAKYRITAAEVTDADGAEVTSNSAGAAKRDDLLRMHAYRDAIRRSAGAYVLYPGGGTPTRTSEYHEILPGVGAFPLCPGVAEAANGRAALTEFVRDVVHHAANQASAAERLQFWQAQHAAAAGRFAAPTELLRRPPADEPVLVGYVRPAARRWVTRTRQYNVRADDRRGSVRLTDDMLVARLVLLWTMVEGRAELVGLFERTGPWLLRLASELEADGYPTRDPDARYLVTALNPAEARHWPADAVAERARSWSPIGEPVARTWADLGGPTPA